MDWKIVFCLALTLAGRSHGDDEVKSLPGLSQKLGFKHFSGYLKGSATHRLHYWFTESQRNPKTDPFVLWLNGGPGCSSVGGLLTELGPFDIAADGFTVKLRPTAWNREANVLFLEAPAGVGYSYSTDGNVTTDDDQTSLENYNALKDFFGNLFPQYRQHDLYITGESYGGVYVPTLVSRILDGNTDFPLNIKERLQGMAIGNGLLSDALNTNSLMKFAYAHGLVDEKLWQTMSTACCKGCPDTCRFDQVTSQWCQNAINNITDETWNQGLNVYDLYRDCYQPEQASRLSRYRIESKWLKPRLFSQGKLIRPTRRSTQQPPSDLNAGAPNCLNETAITQYMNRGDVKRALNIHEGLPMWTDCSDTVEKVYKKVHTDMHKEVFQALRAGLRVLVYNGDTDMACNFLMGQEFSRSLNLPLIHGKKQWHYKGQVVGFVTSYRGLDFVTVKGAGHMVPQWRAGPAFDMITKYLNGDVFR